MAAKVSAPPPPPSSPSQRSGALIRPSLTSSPLRHHLRSVIDRTTMVDNHNRDTTRVDTPSSPSMAAEDTADRVLSKAYVHPARSPFFPGAVADLSSRAYRRQGYYPPQQPPMAYGGQPGYGQQPYGQPMPQQVYVQQPQKSSGGAGAGTGCCACLSPDTSSYPPSTRPHPAGESSVGHGSSAGFALQGAPLFNAANLSRAILTTPGRARQDGDRFLNQAEGLELTPEDRQEGYNPELLPLQPRDTPAAPADALDRRTSPSPAGVPASSRPYAARAHDDSPSASKRKSTGAPGDQGAKDPLGRKTTRLAWWLKPAALAIVLAVVLVAALAVGLGVALTVGERGSGGRSGVATGIERPVGRRPGWRRTQLFGHSSSTGVSTGDVQPSISAGGCGAVFGVTAVPTTSESLDRIVRRTVTRWA
ncbi:hypothetical protein JCM21900_003243 [Sporobolomyces salmonicolor]